MSREKPHVLKNRGFSLIELIIVIAIMAILVGTMAPSLLRYVERTRRTVDVNTAREICAAFERVIILVDPGTGSGNMNFTRAVLWNKDAVRHDPPVNIVDYVFEDLGEVPISVTDEDYFWMVEYNAGNGQVTKICLTDGPSGTLSLEVYPNYADFLSGN